MKQGPSRHEGEGRVGLPDRRDEARPERSSGIVTNRAWTALTTGALLVLGADGLAILVTTGQVAWASLVSLALGTINLVDLVRRWSELGD